MPQTNDSYAYSTRDPDDESDLLPDLKGFPVQQRKNEKHREASPSQCAEARAEGRMGGPDMRALAGGKEGRAREASIHVGGLRAR